MKQEKRKKRGGEKAKNKSQDCRVTFKPPKTICLLHIPAQYGITILPTILPAQCGIHIWLNTYTVLNPFSVVLLD